MIVKKALNVLAQEIDSVLYPAALQLTFDAPLSKCVAGDVKHDEQVGHLYPVIQDWAGVGVVIRRHHQGLQIPIVAVVQEFWHLRWH